MIYIYDILLNFNRCLYNFYEWDKKDNIKLYKKIPMFRVSKELINCIFNNEVRVDKSFVNIIKDKSFVYEDENITSIKNICILTDTNEVIALLFSDSGRIIKKSRLYIADEVEILELSTNLKELLLDYKVIKNNNYSVNYRYYSSIDNKLYNVIDKIDNNDLILYLGYDLFKKNNVDKNELKKLIFDSDIDSRIKYLSTIDSIL